MVYEYFMEIVKNRKTGYLPLIDPDKLEVKNAVELSKKYEEAGADGILVGGSFLVSTMLDYLLGEIKRVVKIPVIIFPGGANQVSKNADAIFYLSLISGRNANWLIEEHVKSAPIIKAYNLEAISVGYMLIDSGKVTSAQYVSNTQPIPRDKNDIAVAHALAAEYLGMKMIYLEAGSGAEKSVPDEMIRAVRECVSIPIIVGGGIRSPDEASMKVRAGANFVVTGTILEESKNTSLPKEFANAVHSAII